MSTKWDKKVDKACSKMVDVETEIQIQLESILVNNFMKRINEVEEMNGFQLEGIVNDFFEVSDCTYKDENDIALQRIRLSDNEDETESRLAGLSITKNDTEPLQETLLKYYDYCLEFKYFRYKQRQTETKNSKEVE